MSSKTILIDSCFKVLYFAVKFWGSVLFSACAFFRLWVRAGGRAAGREVVAWQVYAPARTHTRFTHRFDVRTAEKSQLPLKCHIVHVSQEYSSIPCFKRAIFDDASKAVSGY